MFDDLRGEARRIAVGARRIRGRQIRRAVARAVEGAPPRRGPGPGRAQIDSVNVLARAHYLPLFARLGAYDRARASTRSPGVRARALQYWCHQASLAPVELYPWFRFRMERARKGVGTWGRIALREGEARLPPGRAARDRDARGPLAASELSTAKKTTTGWWGWSEAKHAVERSSGRAVSRSRRGGAPSSASTICPSV